MSRPARPLFLAAAALLALAGCSSGTSRVDPTPDPEPSCLSTEPAPAVELDLLPGKLPLADWGTVTEVRTQGGFIGARAISEVSIVELYPEIVRTLTTSSFRLLGGENEGFEAEITLESHKQQLTTLTLRMGECDEVIIQVLMEQEAGT